MAISNSFLLNREVAAVGVGHGVLRVTANRFTVVGDRFVEVFLVVPGVAAVDVRVDQLGVDPNGLIVVGDGLVEFSLFKQGVAAIVVTQPRRWDRSEWPHCSRRWLCRILLPGPGVAAVVEGHGVLGVDLNDPTVIGNRLIEICLFEPGVSAVGTPRRPNRVRAGWPRRNRPGPCRAPFFASTPARGCGRRGRIGDRSGSPR